jgi:hypothetical protein
MDGCEESTSRETRYSQPTGIPIQMRTEPTAIRPIKRVPRTLRDIARVYTAPAGGL